MFSFRERFAAVRKLLEPKIASGRVRLSHIEKRLPQPNYTIETLRALRLYCHEKPVIVIGADQAEGLSRWYKADELIREFSFVVFARRGSTLPEIPDFYPYMITDFEENVSSSEIREKFINPRGKG